MPSGVVRGWQSLFPRMWGTTEHTEYTEKDAPAFPDGPAFLVAQRDLRVLRVLRATRR